MATLNEILQRPDLIATRQRIYAAYARLAEVSRRLSNNRRSLEHRLNTRYDAKHDATIEQLADMPEQREFNEIQQQYNALCREYVLAKNQACLEANLPPAECIGDVAIGYNLSCTRCGHNWMPRGLTIPKFCPQCNSPYWDKPRKSS